MSGFVKIHRAFFDSEQWRTPADAQAALWLIIHVAWKERWQRCGTAVERVDRGQGFWSLRYLATAWGVTVKQVRGILEHFEETGFLVTQAGTRGTKLTICNYAKYQDFRTDEGTLGAHEGHTEGTNKKKERREEGKRGETRATRLAPDWQPTTDDVEFARKEGLTDDECAREADKFRDYWIAQAGQRGTKRDWPATWRSWVRRAADDIAKRRSGGNPRGGGGGAESRIAEYAEFAASLDDDGGMGAHWRDHPVH